MKERSLEKQVCTTITTTVALIDDQFVSGTGSYVPMSVVTALSNSAGTLAVHKIPGGGVMGCTKNFIATNGVLYSVSFSFNRGSLPPSDNVQVDVIDLTTFLPVYTVVCTTSMVYSFNFTGVSTGTYQLKFERVGSNSSKKTFYLDNILITYQQTNTSCVTASQYRYGFNGMEKDDELEGEGNSLNYTFRMYDTRLGKFFIIDPLATKFPDHSPYAFCQNRVIDAIELEGLELYVINGTLGSEPLESGQYSEQIINTKSAKGKTVAELFGNSSVIKCPWLGANNTQARISEADCVFEKIIATHVQGEAITIMGHSHGGNVAILAAEKVYQYYAEKGEEVKINLVTLNTPNVVDGGYQLSEEASNQISWYQVSATNDKVIKQAGFNKTGILNEGGETAKGNGKPTGEFSYKDDFESNKSGSTRRLHPQADYSIEYKDKTGIGSVFKKGGFKNIVRHRGWLPANTSKWIKDLEKKIPDTGKLKDKK